MIDAIRAYIVDSTRYECDSEVDCEGIIRLLKGNHGNAREILTSLTTHRTMSQIIDWLLRHTLLYIMCAPHSPAVMHYVQKQYEFMLEIPGFPARIHPVPPPPERNGGL